MKYNEYYSNFRKSGSGSLGWVRTLCKKRRIQLISANISRHPLFISRPPLYLPTTLYLRTTPQIFINQPILLTLTRHCVSEINVRWWSISVIENSTRVPIYALGSLKTKEVGSRIVEPVGRQNGSNGRDKAEEPEYNKRLLYGQWSTYSLTVPACWLQPSHLHCSHLFSLFAFTDHFLSNRDHLPLWLFSARDEDAVRDKGSHLGLFL